MHYHGSIGSFCSKVLVVVVSVAAPSFTGIIQQQRARAAVSDLQSALILARSEAIKRNTNTRHNHRSTNTETMSHRSCQRRNTCLHNLVRYHKLVPTNIGCTTTAAATASTGAITPTIPTTNIARAASTDIEIESFTGCNWNSALQTAALAAETSSSSALTTDGINLQP